MTQYNIMELNHGNETISHGDGNFSHGDGALFHRKSRVDKTISHRNRTIVYVDDPIYYNGTKWVFVYVFNVFGHLATVAAVVWNSVEL